MFDENSLDEISNLMVSKMNSLLEIIQRLDKVSWFGAILVGDPTDEQLDYVDEIFSLYKEITESGTGKLESYKVKKLCKLVFKVEITRRRRSMSRSVIS